MTDAQARAVDGPDLKPCPFCGGKGVYTERAVPIRGAMNWRVECEGRFNTCPVNMRTRHHRDVVCAAAAWNTRKP